MECFGTPFSFIRDPRAEIGAAASRIAALPHGFAFASVSRREHACAAEQIHTHERKFAQRIWNGRLLFVIYALALCTRLLTAGERAKIFARSAKFPFRYCYASSIARGAAGGVIVPVLPRSRLSTPIHRCRGPPSPRKRGKAKVNGCWDRKPFANKFRFFRVPHTSPWGGRIPTLLNAHGGSRATRPTVDRVHLSCLY